MANGILAEAVETAFDEADALGLSEVITYQRAMGDPVRDPATGKSTIPIRTYPGVPAIFVQFTERDRASGHVESRDEIMLIEARQLRGFEASRRDTALRALKTGGQQRLEFVRVDPVPGKSFYQIHVRPQ